MADITPGEANVERDGAQLNLRQARAIADDAGTVRGQAGQGHADRKVLDEGDRPNVASSGDPGRGAAGGDSGEQHLNDVAPDGRQFADSETALGGADSVQKTTWGVGHGGEPDGTQELFRGQTKKGHDTMVARVSTGGGTSPIVWVVGLVGALAMLVYMFGVFRR